VGAWVLCQSDAILRELYDEGDALLAQEFGVTATGHYGALTQDNGDNWCAIAVNQDGWHIGVSVSKPSREEAESRALGFAGGPAYAHVVYAWYNDLTPVALPGRRPVIGKSMLITPNVFQITLLGTIGSVCRLESTSQLGASGAPQWQPVATVTNQTGAVVIQDSVTPGTRAKFYRVVQLR